ncbi:hypothetical protein WA1_42500 [Scytonema hofmannii PCC 7110]|uniref:DUF1997 domain-containing protein n=1 Tax=Scytonema hofmannii PCC 7110 TaxID=128403 RepID=A0A139WVD5_9CYAN|nr:DUF1997 domain-containing protein [Scytonema hofmannii]KYC36384.1 hypothetical protein WA1_42500 [Scytonema hofmannii PCC 7110]
MISNNSEYQSFDKNEAVFSIPSTLEASEETTLEATIGTPRRFYGSYRDCMEMPAPSKTVAEYLDNHALWFSRCAEPMKVESLGNNGYALTIGRFGAFGYDVEPKIGLELLPPDEGIYRIRTIPIPNYQAPGYDVDYKSSLQLLESDPSDSDPNVGKITRVEWDLHLAVYIHFPKFIQRLPKSIIQSTGDRLLNQIVRQVSRRLTHKVQEDFHKSLQ